MHFQTTTKQYYKKYLWRLEIYAEGGRLLDYHIYNLAEALDHRLAVTKYWHYHRSIGNTLQNANLELLGIVRDIKLEFTGRIRTRIEEPNIQFYAEDEETLKAIAERLEPKSCIVSITSPTPGTETLLTSGAIIARTPVEYRYKVIFRDGRYSTEIKQQILSYLNGLGDAVKLSQGCRAMLDKAFPSMWNVFVYTNDPAITTFLSLIHPNIISNIHELVNVGE